MCVQWVVLIRNQPPCSSFGTCKLFAKLISFDVRYTNVTQYSGYVARQMLHHHGSNQLISQLRHSTQTIHACHQLQQQGLSLCMMEMCEVQGTGSIIIKHAPDLEGTQLASEVSFSCLLSHSLVFLRCNSHGQFEQHI